MNVSERDAQETIRKEVDIRLEDCVLGGILVIPPNAGGLVVFVHGSGSSRLSPRNQFVAGHLNEGGLATLLFDLLTGEEEMSDRRTGHLRFNIKFLTGRLKAVTSWTRERPETSGLKTGYFGASTGAAAALTAAADYGRDIGAVVSRGGRPDMAVKRVAEVQSPTLLIVGGLDADVLTMNEEAYAHIKAEKDLSIVEGATHLFEEPGKLEEVARLSREWFGRYLTGEKGSP